MAGVLGRLIGPQKRAIYRDPKSMELETAKEILAEVFKVQLSEVDEMIRNRFEVAGGEDIGREDIGREDIGREDIGREDSSSEGLWPQEFLL